MERRARWFLGKHGRRCVSLREIRLLIELPFLLAFTNFQPIPVAHRDLATAYGCAIVIPTLLDENPRRANLWAPVASVIAVGITTAL